MNANKPVHADNVPTPTEPGRRQFLHEEVSRRARKLWQERNQPVGMDEVIWLEAESQLQAEAESRPVSGTDSRPLADEPAKPVRSQTKSRDPADAAAQTRGATEKRAKDTGGRIRNQ